MECNIISSIIDSYTFEEGIFVKVTGLFLI